MKRIIMHWTAGGNHASDIDRKHYHEIVQGDGSRVPGDLLPEANLNTSDGVYAAHTRALNTGSIGLSMAAMRGAREHPFNRGNSPIMAAQLHSFIQMVAEYADTYKIPITRRTVLSHAEVQPTLGVWQRGKWDIAWLPGMSQPDDPVRVGDELRAMVVAAQKKMRGARQPFWMRWVA